jgi:hypothetical protein
MPTLQEKLGALLRKIKENTYDATQLANMVTLQKKIQSDIDANDSVEAMALLGYLLKYQYVVIVPEKGIILNEDKIRDIELIMKG